MNSSRILLTFLFILFGLHTAVCQKPLMARIHYDGGGDWYGNHTAFLNIISKLNSVTGANYRVEDLAVQLNETELFNFPILYISGHGNIKFSGDEVVNLRQYLLAGGFLWADDDYGMDHSFRREMLKVFPNLKWQPIPYSHPIYHCFYNFDNGLPKVHEHDGGPPQGLGLFYNGRLIVFYSKNTDISDGCENPGIHNDPEAIRIKALEMAVNILIFGLTY